MATWRMSFRAGNQGQEMWPYCLKWKVAAITYLPLDRTDLSALPKGEPEALWAALHPTQKASLRSVAYEMNAGDTIYVKRGPAIISKGLVTGPYLRRRRRRRQTGWRHHQNRRPRPQRPRDDPCARQPRRAVGCRVLNDVSRSRRGIIVPTG